jgi:cobalamin biosynthesis Mg chelatase CobN
MRRNEAIRGGNEHGEGFQVREEERSMQSPWFGGIIMLIMLVGLGVWIWKMMRKSKEE